MNDPSIPPELREYPTPDYQPTRVRPSRLRLALIWIAAFLILLFVAFGPMLLAVA